MVKRWNTEEKEATVSSGLCPDKPRQHADADDVDLGGDRVCWGDLESDALGQAQTDDFGRVRAPSHSTLTSTRLNPRIHSAQSPRCRRWALKSRHAIPCQPNPGSTDFELQLQAGMNILAAAREEKHEYHGANTAARVKTAGFLFGLGGGPRSISCPVTSQGQKYVRGKVSIEPFVASGHESTANPRLNLDILAWIWTRNLGELARMSSGLRVLLDWKLEVETALCAILMAFYLCDRWMNPGSTRIGRQ